MRKVTEKTAKAFFNREYCTVGNTAAFPDSVYLHGNLIAELTKDNRLRLTLAGWNTPTTRERLNGILEVFGINAEIFQRNFDPYLMYEECRERISPDQWIEIHLS